MIVLQTIMALLSGIVIFFLLLPTLTVILSLFSKEKIKRIEPKDPGFKSYDFGCILTAYKNAKITEPLIQSLLRQHYDNFVIYLVADECDISDWTLEDPRLVVFRPDPPLRLKAKSIIYAIENFSRSHEYVAVFDADNVVHPDFLKELNVYANNGLSAIQGQRTAKNLDTPYACADSTGEFYKNYIERYAPYLIGGSAVISGSGMAVETELYKAYLYGDEIQQGKTQWKKMLQEDKILQNDLLRKNERIAYAWDAIVYDEKVTTADQVETQRSRWLFSYFQNLPNSTGLILKGLTRFSFNQFYFGLITVSPPLFILLFLSVVLAAVNILVNPMLTVALIASIVIFVLTIIWTLSLSKVPKQIWETLWGLPLFVWNQVTALFKMRNPNKNFKHTEHTRNYSIDEILEGGQEKRK